MLAEVVAQPHRLAGVVDELRVQRKLLVQMLLHADLLQHRAAAGRRCSRPSPCRHSWRPAPSTPSAQQQRAERCADRRRPCHRPPNCPPAPSSFRPSQLTTCNERLLYFSESSPRSLPCRSSSSVRALRWSSAHSRCAQSRRSAAPGSPARAACATLSGAPRSGSPPAGRAGQSAPSRARSECESFPAVHPPGCSAPAAGPRAHADRRWPGCRRRYPAAARGSCR